MAVRRFSEPPSPLSTNRLSEIRTSKSPSRRYIPVWLPMKMLLRILYPVLRSVADQAGGPQGPGLAAGEHEPVDDGVGRADMQPVAGGLEDGLLRELSGLAGLRWLPGTPALAPRNVSVLVIIVVSAAKCPGPNWIVSPDAATSTALASVAHAPPARPASRGVVAGGIDGNGRACAAAGNATSSASAASSPNSDRRHPRYDTNAARDVLTMTTSHARGAAGPEGPARSSGPYAVRSERATPGCSVPQELGMPDSGGKAVSKPARSVAGLGPHRASTHPGVDRRTQQRAPPFASTGPSHSAPSR